MVQQEQVKQGKSFADYYKDVKKQRPCKEFLQMVADSCGVTPNAVYRWISGEYIPDMLKKEKISNLLNVPVEVLFPEQ